MARKFRHHFAVHVHPSASSGQAVQHRAHLITIAALFTYLQILAVFSFGFFLVRGTTQVLGAVTFGREQIIELTNISRRENGLPELVENSRLNQAAEAKAADMIAFDYWAHYSPQGKTPWQFINAAGYKYTFAGENLARDFGDGESVVNAWMNSPSHRSNMLDKNFREIGVAIENGKLGGREGTLVVQMFGTNPQSPTAEESRESRVESRESAESQVAGEQGKNYEVGIMSYGNFGLAKSVTLGLTAFMFLLFTVELSLSLKRAHFKLQSAVLAHMLILGFVMAVLWYSTSGAIK